MREELSTGTTDPLLLERATSPPQTPAASSIGASSPAIPINIGAVDWLGHGKGSKAGSLSGVGSQPPRTSLSTCVGSSQSSCRPWERGDLLRRLATFKPSNWSGKPKVASSLACARRGWLNIDIDKIACESCGAHLSFTVSASCTPGEVDSAGGAFAKQLDASHKVTCPWKGNSCTESLVQFPPTPPSALIGGYKDRCDGLLQFPYLPVVASSAIEQMKLSRGLQIDRLLSQLQIFSAGEFGFKAESMPGAESSREEAWHIYSQAQKLISLCGWEPRWLLNVQDCEEHSAQSARNACSVGPSQDQFCPSYDPNKNSFSASAKRDTGKRKMSILESRCDSRSALLDCSLCGATVRLMEFLTVPRLARFSPNVTDTPETSKKLALTRGVSAASGISGWVATDGLQKELIEGRDEAATTDEGKSLSNVGVDLNLTMGGGLPSTQFGLPAMSERFEDAARGTDRMIGQPSGSEVGDRAASYESRGPSTRRKRSLEEAGSTVDRPHGRMQPADSVEGTVIDRDGDEVNGGRQYSGGPSKRPCDSGTFYAHHLLHRGDASCAGRNHSLGFEIDIEVNRADPFALESEQMVGLPPSTRDSARASSVIAMDTVCHSDEEDSMESVENYPGYIDDAHFPLPSVSRIPDVNDVSELNQAQQSTCLQPETGRVAREMGGSSIDDGEEILNAEAATVHARGALSFGISGGSVGMGASHEAEIHGADVSVQRTESIFGEAELTAEVTENQGQTGEFVPDPGLMDEFVPDEMHREDAHGDSQDMISRSVGRADSGSKIDGSAKAESVESGEKLSHALGHGNSGHPSLSCNATIYSGYEVSKGEVTQAGKGSLNDDCTLLESEYNAAIGIGQANGESNYEGEAGGFDPLKHHHQFCPWVDGNVAAAGCSSEGSVNTGAVALCGWQLTLDALDAFQSSDHVPIQIVESESAASLYKDEHLIPVQKLLGRHSVSKGHGQR